jgi:electron transfer flavoprotein alpha subunit
MTVLVWVDLEGGEPDGLSLEALTFGRGLAATLGVPLDAVVVGAEAPAAALGAYGVATVHAVRDDRLGSFAPAAWAQGIVDVIDATLPQAVLAAGGDRGAEVMAHVAAKTGYALAASCTSVTPGDAYEVTRLRWGGSLLEDARLSGDIKLLTVAPHALSASPAADAAGAPAVVDVTPNLSDDDLRVQVIRREEPEGGTISLADAKVVVGGGRGVGSAEGFADLDALASALGGTVGVSRVVTSLGWRPHAQQVGQTGARIAPDLYIACGISGAIQHIVGCKAAKKILVINTDPEAPILSHADYAIVGDLKTVVPAITAELAKVQAG